MSILLFHSPKPGLKRHKRCLLVSYVCGNLSAPCAKANGFGETTYTCGINGSLYSIFNLYVSLRCVGVTSKKQVNPLGLMLHMEFLKLYRLFKAEACCIDVKRLLLTKKRVFCI